MPKTFTQNNFSQGWVPSDDPINGRQNGLIKMENITLAENGSLTIANGSTNEYTLSTGKVHTIFANTVSHVYSVCDDGKAYYNTTQLYTDCSDSAAAFCIAGNALLFNSGSELQILTGTSSTTRGFNLDTPAVPVKLETGFFSLITEVGSIITLYNYLTNTDKENGDWSFSFGDYTYEIDPELTAYDVSSTNIPLTAGGTYTYDNSWVATASKTVSSATDAQGTFNGDFKAQALFTSDTTANLSALYAYPLIPPQP
ncbi:MAG: hypothetical protein ACREHG_01295, partial [Candidatus Saccharimonadales bacterium]